MDLTPKPKSSTRPWWTLFDCLSADKDAQIEKLQHELALAQKLLDDAVGNTKKLTENMQSQAKEKDSVIAKLSEEISQQTLEALTSQSSLNSLKEQMTIKEEEHQTSAESLTGQISSQNEKLQDLENKLEAAFESNAELSGKVALLKSTNGEAKKTLAEKKVELEEAGAYLVAQEKKSMEEVTEIQKAKLAAEEHAAALEGTLKEEQAAAAAKYAEVESKLDASVKSISQLTEEVASLKKSNNESKKHLVDKEALAISKSIVAALQEEASTTKSHMEELQSKYDAAQVELEKNKESAASTQLEKDELLVMLELEQAVSKHKATESEKENTPK